MTEAAQATVTPIHTGGRMTEAEYDRRRAELRATYGDNKHSANARREQELAKLLTQSGWTRDQLAKKEGLSVTHTNRLLLFGKFLAFECTYIQKPQKAISESEFNRYWKRTEADTKFSGGKGTTYNERQRFIRVIQLIVEESEAEGTGKRPSIVKDIIKQFSDGEWHPVEKIAKKLDTTVDHVMVTMKSMNDLSRAASNESKPVGKSRHYRIFKKEKTVPATELSTKLKPIVEKLQAEGRKSIVTMSPPTVAHLAHELAKLIDEWTE